MTNRAWSGDPLEGSTLILLVPAEPTNIEKRQPVRENLPDGLRRFWRDSFWLFAHVLDYRSSFFSTSHEKSIYGLEKFLAR